MKSRIRLYGKYSEMRLTFPTRVRTALLDHSIRTLNVLAGKKGKGYLRPTEEMVPGHAGVRTPDLLARGWTVDSGKSKRHIKKNGCPKGKDQKDLDDQMKDLGIFLEIRGLKHVATSRA